MKEQLFTLIPLAPESGTIAPGLTLTEAFTRLMAVAERDYMFFRTCWVMHLVSPKKPAGEPEFESPLAVDGQARAAIMRQVCEHGLGLFRMVTDEQFFQESAAHEWIVLLPSRFRTPEPRHHFAELTADYRAFRGSTAAGFPLEKFESANAESEQNQFAHLVS
jgi:hypothetical protein